MTAPTFNGSFPHKWTAEILPQRPMILPSRHYVYPAIAEEVEKGALEVLIQQNAPESEPESQPKPQPFLATCALGFRDPAAPTGIWSMPNPDWLCAVSGGYAYLIDVPNPENFVMLHYRPVLEILPLPEQNLILFIGHHAILAWGTNGESWQSNRLSSEGITIDSVEENKLNGHGWDLMTDKDTPFILDLATGERIAS
jgi:hypothetical protein